jgi:hypothetical protein
MAPPSKGGRGDDIVETGCIQQRISKYPMPRKKHKSKKDSVAGAAFHKRLEGFDIRVNTFGEMESTFEIEKLNSFLDEELKDKKLKKKDKKQKS